MSRARLLTVSPKPPVLRARVGERRPLRLQGRLTWRDTSGALRSVSVMTQNASEHDVLVECLTPARIPLYRLVHVQLETVGARADDPVPVSLREGPVLAAVYRASQPSRTTGTPREYALRLLVEPCRLARPVAYAAAARN